MKTHILVAALNIVFDSVYVGFVTAAAMHFDKPAILFWYLLILFTGFNIKTKEVTTKDKEEDHG